MSNIPKILIISHNPFSDTNNNGKTLKSIFSTFPKESLCQFYIRPQENITCDSRVANSYYAVSEMDILRKIIHPFSQCGGIQTFDKAKDIQTTNNNTYQRFKHSNIRNNKVLRMLLWKTNLWNNKGFKNWYHDEKPDAVFALLGSPDITYDIAIQISSVLKIPLFLYFTDDYLIHPVRKGFFSRWKYKIEEKKYREIINHSAQCFAIGDMMCKEYATFFGRSFLPIMNLADVVPYQNQIESHTTLTISYFGSMSLNRWKMISSFSELINDKAVIYVYTGDELTQEMSLALHKTNIIVCSLVKGEEYEARKRESDILLHVESDELEHRSRTALSVSTKLPDYMIAGRMIIGYGPSEVASMKLISDNNIGSVFSSEEDRIALKENVKHILEDGNMRLSYGKRAYEYAITHFDKKANSESVKTTLSRIINS